jgi:hypothetical protein
VFDQQASEDTFRVSAQFSSLSFDKTLILNSEQRQAHPSLL